MTKAVCYLRVSTDEQADSGAGLAAQADSCRAHAGRLGWRIAGTFADEGISGGEGLERRPALLDAIASLSKGEILLVAKRDRIGRLEPLKMAMIEAAVARKGARIVSAAGEGTEGDDPSHVLMRRMVDAFGEYERLIIKSRTRSALMAKRARGERIGQVPYGKALAADGRRLIEDVDEMDVLVRIRGLRAEGLSLRQIADVLTERGIPTKRGGPRWAPSTVAELLGREESDGRQHPQSAGDEADPELPAA